mgnify:CR=1 FL=1
MRFVIVLTIALVLLAPHALLAKDIHVSNKASKAGLAGGAAVVVLTAHDFAVPKLVYKSAKFSAKASAKVAVKSGKLSFKGLRAVARFIW